MLDRLVGRPVLAKADRVMGHDVDHLALQRAEADRRPAVVGKDQEGAAIRQDAAMLRHAVHRRGHAELADPVVDVAAAVVSGVERLLRLGLGVVGPGEVGRAADRCRNRVVDRLQRHFRRLAGRDLGRIGDQLVEIGL